MLSEDPSEKRNPLLPWPGELEPGMIGFVNENGEQVENEAVFPIFKQHHSGEWELIGTGFFISPAGFFVTAKHVMMDVLDEHNRQKYPAVSLVQFLPGGVYIMRGILQFSVHPTADLAIGKPEVATDNRDGSEVRSKFLSLTLDKLAEGDEVSSFAFPRHHAAKKEDVFTIDLRPAFYAGTVQQFCENGRGCAKLITDCYRTNMHVYGGASGGPVMNRVGDEGNVVAINSSSFEGAEDVSYITPIHYLLEMNVPQIAFNHGDAIRDIPVPELIQEGLIRVV